LPGASPENMEDLVTKKIEKEIAKVDGIDTITSTSQNSVSSIIVQFKSNVDTKNAVREVKDKVDIAKPNLPSDVKEPIIKEVSFSDTPIWTFAVSGNYD
jgi:multidrug efflux pump subunit AcrB